MTTPRLGDPDYTHLLLECRGCLAAMLDDRQAIADLLEQAAHACALHVVHRAMHAFAPHGLTGYLLLEESHISVHTWPERGFMLMDVLSCAPLDCERLVEAVRQILGTVRVVVCSADGPRAALEAGRGDERADRR